MRMQDLTLSPHKTKLPTEFDQIDVEMVQLNDKLNHLVDDYYRSDDMDEKTQVLQKQKEIQKQIDQLKRQKMDMVKSGTHPQAESWLNKIEQECGEFVKLCQELHVWLYSGMRGNYTVNAIEGKSRLYRKPTDSSPTLSNQFDEYLSQMGIAALRSNSLFTTTDSSQAYNYGPVFIVFPKDHKYKFSYTTQKDLVLDTNTAHQMENFETFEQAFDPRDTNLEYAMTRGLEILINGEYIAIRANTYAHMVKRRWGVHVDVAS